jgi:hypothetical protein
MALKTASICSHCLRGQHTACTIPDTCGCETCNPPVVLWEDPPADGRGKSNLSRRLLTPEQEAEMRANPKRWALIKQFSSKSGARACVTKIRQGKSPGLDQSEWEAVSRIVDSGSRVYLRYVGPGDSA